MTPLHSCGPRAPPRASRPIAGDSEPALHAAISPWHRTSTRTRRRRAELRRLGDRGLGELAVVEVVVEAAAAPAARRGCPARRCGPSSMTTIVSALRIVESRCAITKLVRPCRSRAIAAWIRTSVRVSTLLVASSRMRMLGSARNARAIVSSCLWPDEMLEASSSSTVS